MKRVTSEMTKFFGRGQKRMYKINRYDFSYTKKVDKIGCKDNREIIIDKNFEDIKFPTFYDPYIKNEDLKKSVSYETISSDMIRVKDILNKISSEFDLLLLSESGLIIKRLFRKFNYSFVEPKLYLDFLDRHITLISLLITKNLSQNLEEKENSLKLLKNTFVGIDYKNLIKKYSLEVQETYSDKIEKIINKQLNIEKELISFDEENQSYKPSFTSISTSLIVLSSVLESINKLLIEIKNSSAKNEDIIIQFFHNLKKLEVLINYILLSYNISEDDIYNLPEDSDVWIKLKKYYERKEVYSRDVVNRQIQKIFDIITLGSASVSKACSQYDNKLLRILGFSWNMLYYSLNKKKAKIQSMKFGLNPDLKLTHKIWDAMDARGMKYLLKLTLPKIEYSKVWYIKKTEDQINFDKIKYFNELSQNLSSNHLPISTDQVNLDYNEKDSLIKEKVDSKNIENYVKVRIISDNNVRVKMENSSSIDKDEASSASKNHNGNSIIIHVHGGGHISMSSDSHEPYTRKWADQLKVPIFSIDYRLAPDHPFPQTLDDLYQAYMWIVKYAGEILNIDVKNIILTGDSAGGNLATALTYLLILQKKKLPTALLIPNESVVSYFNVLNDQVLPFHVMKYCLECYRKDYINQKDPFVTPNYMNENVLNLMPPVRILCGSSDPFRDDSLHFTKKLSDLNKDVKYVELKHFPHGFLNYELLMPEARVGSEIIVEEMKKFI